MFWRAPHGHMRKLERPDGVGDLKQHIYIQGDVRDVDKASRAAYDFKHLADGWTVLLANAEQLDRHSIRSSCRCFHGRLHPQATL